MNAINVIAPYRHLGMWVFDDPRVGLEAEPFVGGADTIIDLLVREIPDAASGFCITFSAGAFPGYEHRLDWVRPELSGNVYRLGATGMEGWLCPALLKYFAKPPSSIYLRVTARPGIPQA